MSFITTLINRIDNNNIILAFNVDFRPKEPLMKISDDVFGIRVLLDLFEYIFLLDQPDDTLWYYYL